MIIAEHSSVKDFRMEPGLGGHTDAFVARDLKKAYGEFARAGALRAASHTSNRVAGMAAAQWQAEYTIAYLRDASGRWTAHCCEKV